MFLFIGALADVNAWIIGPAKGLLVVAQDHFLTVWLKRENEHNVPTALLLMQALVGSTLALIFLYLRDSSASMWFLTALSAQFTCVQYLLVFCAALKLRYKRPGVVRAFKTPAIWLVTSLGSVACIFSFFIVYAPHQKLVALQWQEYCALLILSFLLLLLPTWLLIRFRARSNPAK